MRTTKAAVVVISLLCCYVLADNDTVPLNEAELNERVRQLRAELARAEQQLQQLHGQIDDGSGEAVIDDVREVSFVEAENREGRKEDEPKEDSGARRRAKKEEKDPLEEEPLTGGESPDASTTTPVPTEPATAPDDPNWKPAKRRSPPRSASLPNRQSTYFLQRLQSLIKEEQERQGETDNRVMADPIATSTSSEQHDPPPLQFSGGGGAGGGGGGGQFNPIRNNTAEQCQQFSQQQLVTELKRRGTYNPDLMAWDALGVIRFLDRTLTDQYEHQLKGRVNSSQVIERNVEALERILLELNVTCDLGRGTHLKHGLAMNEPRRSVISPSLRKTRSTEVDAFFEALGLVAGQRREKREQKEEPEAAFGGRQKMIGESHVVPFGCDARGAEEAGYLRLCGACQSVRRLPESFFPPFINEVTCDSDKACLYFYDYPHGKCRQKHMNFVVLRNVGTQECQVWKKFNLNVRVSCECFVDEMSFFAKYV